jgi:hypothetical protein
MRVSNLYAIVSVFNNQSGYLTHVVKAIPDEVFSNW